MPKPAADLNDIFDRIDREHRTTQINIFRSEDRWQVSMKRPKGGSVFSISVKPTLVGALIDCLGSETGVTRQTTSYWFHPESESVMAVPAGEQLPFDACDEIDQADYWKLLAKQQAGDPNAPLEDDDDDDGMDLI